MSLDIKKYIGRVVRLDVVYTNASGSTRPASGDYVPIGALRTKNFALAYDEVDATADDTVGGIRETLTTYKSLTISGDGTSKRSDDTLSNQTALTKYVFNPPGDTPCAWIRIVYPDITIEYFALITTMNRDNTYDDVATYSFEAKSTVSDFGLVVTDTP